MENYSHFIITRFNLNLYAQDKHDLPTRTDRWLEHRFEVFERYCLPSVAAQTSGNFTWLCLFDAATPESCRRRIEGYKARCPQFEAVYYTAAQAANLTENLRTTIAAYVSCDRKGRKSPPPPRSC
ncbi:MAG: glycosyltransferase [Alistipes sp.]|uniref:glycosyltransferase n=1 Tax=Alistipes sp. TaxID=1872444 RepID=UPI00242EB543|nr:glycosyltransferase [Alistipes onderdonkii]